MSGSVAAPRCLDGVRVLELADSVAGAFCGKLLAGLGADVLKIEAPGRGSAYRTQGPNPNPDSVETGALHLHLDTGKRSLAAPLDAVEGRSLIHDLVRDWATIFVVDLPLAELRARGLAWETLKALNPALVVASVTPFGLRGPYAGLQGTELISLALGGYLYLTGEPNREPLKPFGHQAGYHAGLHTATGAIAALRRAEATGKGELVDAAVVGAASFLCSAAPGWAHFYGRVPTRAGNRLANLDPKNMYPSTMRPCADGWVHAHTNVTHPDLLQAMVPDERWETPGLMDAPMGNADQIDTILDDWLCTRTRSEVVALAQELRVPFTEVLAPDEVLASEHLQVRGRLLEIDHPGAGRVTHPHAPVGFGVTPWITDEAPTLGSAIRPQAERLSQQHPVRDPSRAQPLAGVRVIELTLAVAGPVAGHVLADLGADVVKVEAPFGRNANPSESVNPPAGRASNAWDRVPKFNELNRGKRSVVLDLATPRGRDALLRLAAGADVVIENFAPRVLPNLDIGYEVLRAANPRIILVSMPGFGEGGPYSQRVSYGPGIDAMSGLADLTGYEAGGPMKPGNHYCDQNAGVLAALAVIAALRHAERSGEGQRVEVAMLDGELQTIGEALIAASMGAPVPARQGNTDAHMAPHGVFRCSGEDAWVAIAVRGSDDWRALCSVIGPAFATRPDLATVEGRLQHRTELAAVLGAWCATRSPGQVQAELQALGVPAGAVLNPAELLTDPHLVARRAHPIVLSPDTGETPMPAVAWDFLEHPFPSLRPAPRFGQHTIEVLREAGLTAEDIGAMQRDGVTTDVPGRRRHGPVHSEPLQESRP